MKYLDIWIVTKKVLLLFWYHYETPKLCAGGKLIVLDVCQ